MFGRRKVADDDPFAALKEGGTYQSTPTTTVAGIPGSGLGEEPMVSESVAPTPVAPPTPTPTAVTPIAPTPTAGAPIAPTQAPPPASTTGLGRPTRPVRLRAYNRTSYSGRGGWVASLVVLGIIAAIAVPIISSASHAIHSFTIPSFSVPSPSIPSFSTPTPTPTPTKHRAPTNYLKPAGTRAGLVRIAKRFPGARVTNLRIDSSSMDAFVYTKGGGVKNLSMSASGTFVTSSSGTGGRPIAISAIPPAAVARIVRAMNAKFHVPPKRIDYIVLTILPHLPPQWIAFSKAPSHPGYAARLDGSGLHKLI